jgi:hypothetical protein
MYRRTATVRPPRLTILQTYCRGELLSESFDTSTRVLLGQCRLTSCSGKSQVLAFFERGSNPNWHRWESYASDKEKTGHGPS